MFIRFCLQQICVGLRKCIKNLDCENGAAGSLRKIFDHENTYLLRVAVSRSATSGPMSDRYFCDIQLTMSGYIYSEGRP